jgi:hypothetical protein
VNVFGNFRSAPRCKRCVDAAAISLWLGPQPCPSLMSDHASSIHRAANATDQDRRAIRARRTCLNSSSIHIFFKRQPGRLETPVTHTKQTAATTFNGQLSGTSRLQFSSAQGLGRSHAMSDFQYFNCDLSTSLVFQFRLSNFPLLLRWRHD